MNRKAVLIESSKVKGYSELPGARVDVQNWKKFFLSELGGAWRDAEIVILSHPFSGDVTRELSVSSDTYCFVAFSGHGCEGSIVLNEHFTSFPTKDLRPKGDRGVVVADTCRGFEEAEAYPVTAKAAMVNEALEGPVLLNASRGMGTTFASASELSTDTLISLGYQPSSRRNDFETAVEKCSKGIVDMLACSKGQAAGEDPNAGGYYTSLLLQSAEIWRKKYTQEKIHTTKNAHDYAVNLIPPQQTPEYIPSWLAFPFAVKG